MVTRAKEYSTLNDLTRRVLNFRTCESLNIRSKDGENLPKSRFRLVIGHKSNRIDRCEGIFLWHIRYVERAGHASESGPCPKRVCSASWCITPLTQTEDQLTRDMLAATAGFINCTGGVNGKVVVAVKKSWVIDLEAEASEAGNKGQAGNMQPDRLNPETSKDDAIVESHAISMRGDRNDHPLKYYLYL